MLQLLGRHVIENSGDWFQKGWYGAPKSGWPSSDSSWQCPYMLETTTKIVNAVSSSGVVVKKYSS